MVSCSLDLSNVKHHAPSFCDGLAKNRGDKSKNGDTKFKSKDIYTKFKTKDIYTKFKTKDRERERETIQNSSQKI